LHNGLGATRGINHLLDAVAPADSHGAAGALTPVFLASNTVLIEPGRPIGSVYFPINSVISLVTPLADAAVEVATVGNEGMVGVPLVPRGSLAVRAVAQMAGWVIRMDAVQFLEQVDRRPRLRELVNDYLAGLLAQVAQTAACNRLHSNEQRLSRWLLMSQDRAGRDVLDVSRRSLGERLGSPAVTLAMSAAILEAGGVIRYRYGEFTIVDRTGLEALACVCYEAMRRELDRVLQQPGSRDAADQVLPGRARRGAQREVAAPS
jgi:CRP-like cAMP-binding protein